MRLRQMTAALALAVAATGGSACAMTTESTAAIQCAATGDAAALAALGGADAVCGIVRTAAGSAGVAASVRVELVNANAAVAQATVSGRALQERRVDMMDRALDRRGIESLANAIADQLQALAAGGAAK